MTLGAVVDNDILIKGACYSLLAHFESLLGPGDVGILGAARFVVADRLRRNSSVRDPGRALATWADFLTRVHQLEPTVAEQDLATSIEEFAGAHAYQLDTGESQLCAVAILRPVPVLATGDKRAICALDKMLDDIDGLRELCGRIASLELLMVGVLAGLGRDMSRQQVCAEPAIDRALSICFQCSDLSRPADSISEGLLSYMSDLSRSAPSMFPIREPRSGS